MEIDTLKHKHTRILEDTSSIDFITVQMTYLFTFILFKCQVCLRITNDINLNTPTKHRKPTLKVLFLPKAEEEQTFFSRYKLKQYKPKVDRWPMITVRADAVFLDAHRNRVLMINDFYATAI